MMLTQGTELCPPNLTLAPDPGARLRLVAIYPVLLAGAPQDIRGRPESFVDSWIVRHDEGGQELGHGRGTAPIRASEELDGVVAARENLIFVGDSERDGACNGFVQLDQNASSELNTAGLQKARRSDPHRCPSHRFGSQARRGEAPHSDGTRSQSCSQASCALQSLSGPPMCWHLDTMPLRLRARLFRQQVIAGASAAAGMLKREQRS